MNEGGWGEAFLGQWDAFKQSLKKPEIEKVETVEPEPTQTFTTGKEEETPTVTPAAEKELSAALDVVPGNDDFILYMQHQQGIAGAKSLLQAAAGIGKIHPSTMAVKTCSRLGGKVPYANLQCNIPSDKPDYKKQIVDALNKGDEKKGATLFLKMWKEKWNSKSQQAKISIDKPDNAQIKSLLQKYCKEYGVPFDFATTVALIESGLNPKAGNSKYKGLFALSDSGFKRYAPSGNIFNAEDNCKAGIQILKTNIKEFTKYIGPLIAKLDIGSWAKT